LFSDITKNTKPKSANDHQSPTISFIVIKLAPKKFNLNCMIYGIPNAMKIDIRSLITILTFAMLFTFGMFGYNTALLSLDRCICSSALVRQPPKSLLFDPYASSLLFQARHTIETYPSEFPRVDERAILLLSGSVVYLDP